MSDTTCTHAHAHVHRHMSDTCQAQTHVRHMHMHMCMCMPCTCQAGRQAGRQADRQWRLSLDRARHSAACLRLALHSSSRAAGEAGTPPRPHGATPHRQHLSETFPRPFRDLSETVPRPFRSAASSRRRKAEDGDAARRDGGLPFGAAAAIQALLLPLRLTRRLTLRLRRPRAAAGVRRRACGGSTRDSTRACVRARAERRRGGTTDVRAGGIGVSAWSRLARGARRSCLRPSSVVLSSAAPLLM